VIVKEGRGSGWRKGERGEGESEGRRERRGRKGRGVGRRGERERGDESWTVSKSVSCLFRRQ
jgi:hypothetical protein